MPTVEEVVDVEFTDDGISVVFKPYVKAQISDALQLDIRRRCHQILNNGNHDAQTLGRIRSFIHDYLQVLVDDQHVTL